MKSVSCSKPDNTSITSSKIEHIPYNLIFTAKCNDFLILITIISWDYMNLSLANEYVGDVTIQTQVIKFNQCCSRRISHSDCSIPIKLNYTEITEKIDFRCWISKSAHTNWHSVISYIYYTCTMYIYLILLKVTVNGNKLSLKITRPSIIYQ